MLRSRPTDKTREIPQPNCHSTISRPKQARKGQKGWVQLAKIKRKVLYENELEKEAPPRGVEPRAVPGQETVLPIHQGRWRSNHWAIRPLLGKVRSLGFKKERVLWENEKQKDLSLGESNPALSRDRGRCYRYTKEDLTTVLSDRCQGN